MVTSKCTADTIHFYQRLPLCIYTCALLTPVPLRSLDIGHRRTLHRYVPYAKGSLLCAYRLLSLVFFSSPLPLSFSFMQHLSCHFFWPHSLAPLALFNFLFVFPSRAFPASLSLRLTSLASLGACLPSYVLSGRPVRSAPCAQGQINLSDCRGGSEAGSAHAKV